MAENEMSFDEYIDCMYQKNVNPLIRIEILRPEDETIFSSFIIKPLSGNITVTATNGAIRRSCDIVLPNFDKQFLINSNDMNKLWLNTKFMLYLGIKNPVTEKVKFFPQGEFALFNSDPTVNSDYSNKTTNLTASDKYSILDQPIGQIYQRLPDQPAEATIRYILQQCGDKKEPIIEHIDTLSPNTLRWAATDTWGTALKQIADLYSMECFYDATGHFVFQSYKDVSILNNAWKFTTDEIHYEGSSVVFKFSEIFNKIVVIGGTVDTLTYSASALNNDLTSNSRIDLIGIKTKVITDDKLSSNVLCQQRADLELSKRMRMQELISLKSSPLFHFDVNEAITVVDDSINLHEAKYAMQEFQIDISSHSQMTIQAYKFNDTAEYEDIYNSVSS